MIIKPKAKALVITIALTAIALVLTSTTMAALSVNKSIGSSGGVNVSAGLNIYSDSACTIPITTINWGNISAGGSNSQTVYVKNTGSGVSLTLNMTTSNWTPSNANNYITITWNQETTRLQPAQSVAATITLNVSSSIIDINSFNVQISITGTN